MHQSECHLNVQILSLRKITEYIQELAFFYQSLSSEILRECKLTS